MANIDTTRYAINTLKVGGALLVALAGMESYRGDAYIPTKGDVPTIGYGQTGPTVKMGDKTTPERALAQLYTQAEGVYASGIKRCVTAPVTVGEFSSLVHVAYNAGVAGTCASAMVAKINAGDYEGACKEILRFRVTVKGRDCRIRSNNCYGLVTRRELESRMCQGEFN